MSASCFLTTDPPIEDTWSSDTLWRDEIALVARFRELQTVEDFTTSDERPRWFSVEDGIEWLRSLRRAVIEVADAYEEAADDEWGDDASDEDWDEDDDDDDDEDWDEDESVDDEDEEEDEDDRGGRWSRPTRRRASAAAADDDDDDDDDSEPTLESVVEEVDADVLEAAVGDIDDLLKVFDELRGEDVKWAFEIE